jgi:membrane protein implicated in regulation of membrane protease activity
MTRLLFNAVTDLIEIVCLGCFVAAIALAVPARAMDGRDIAAWAFAGAFAFVAIVVILLALVLTVIRLVRKPVEEEPEVHGDTTGWRP